MEPPSRTSEPFEPAQSDPPLERAKSEKASERPSSDRPRRNSSHHMLAALSASSRSEASLGTLMRAIRDLSSGVSGAREANVLLLREFESLSDLLGASNERQLALKNRVTLLEQTLERVHAEADRERAYILDQQDAFIAAMMEDHEQLIAELHREIGAARGRPSQRHANTHELPSLADAELSADARAELEAAQHTVQKLLAERDRARETLLKLQAQRDEAQASVASLTRELEQLRVGGSQSRLTDAVRQVIPATATPPPGLRGAATLPPPESPRKPAPTPSMPAVEARSPSSPSPSRPRAPNLELSPREALDHPFPPEELRAAIHPPSGSLPAQSPPEPEAPVSAGRADQPFAKRSITPPGPPVSIPPVQSKPESSLRAGGGYSLTNSVAPEHVAAPVRISRAPR